MPRAGARAGAEGSRGAMQTGSVAGGQQKGEGLGLAGVRDIWLRERKATLSAAVQWRVRGSASGIATSREVSWFGFLERVGGGCPGVVAPANFELLAVQPQPHKCEDYGHKPPARPE